jgi:hypothetical protein
MFVLSTPEQSDALHQELIDLETGMFSELGLHFKVGEGYTKCLYGSGLGRQCKKRERDQKRKSREREKKSVSSKIWLPMLMP